MTRLAKLPEGQQRERTRPLSIQSTSCRIIEIKEIIVSGDNFIEWRIILCSQQMDIENLQASAYGRGYKRGWERGLLTGLVIFGVAAMCIWLAFSIG